MCFADGSKGRYDNWHQKLHQGYQSRMTNKYPPTFINQLDTINHHKP